MLPPWSFRLSLVVLLGVGCSSDDPGGSGTNGTHGTDGGSPDLVGSVCEAPSDCYPGVDPASLAGEIECLDRVREGYCTHQCMADEDCCAVEGECISPLPQVCSPFESADAMMCFLSCEDEDVMAGGAEDPAVFCQNEVGPDFICRSSGGGANNRKICVPGDCGVGAACGSDADCSGDFTCQGGFNGGYCGVSGCADDSDCPADSLCVSGGGSSYCARTCATEGDCSFCRGSDVAATCTSEVEFLGAGGSTVCVPDPA